MGKICAVPGCRSRKEGDETRRKKLGLCRITLFSIPKSKDRRNQWKKALDCELDVKQFVCQFHFSEDSIKKSDRIVLTDGTVYDSPLIRWRLNEGAVPISQQCGPMDCEENNNGIEETEQENSALDVKKEQLQISNSVVLDEGTDTAPSILTESWTEQDVDNVKGAVDAFTLGNLKDDLTAGLLSESWAWTQKSTGLIFTLLNRSNLHPQLHLEVALDLTLSIRTITDTVIPLNDQATSSNDIRRYMKILKNCIICSGTGVQSESRDPRCVGMIDLKKPGDNQRKNWRCELCQQIRERVQRRNQRRRKTILKRERAQKKADLTRRKFIRLKRKTKKLYADVADLKRSCSRIEKETLEKNIALLPEAQKQAVRTCLETAKVGNRKGRRYAIEWMYECLLMRIKNSGLYDHIRERKILPLPCRETLSRYIRRISSSAYGFQTAIFEGTLLVDEMKLSEAVSFNKQTLEFQGFVDLGQYTPEEKRMTRADHASVFMFQPFRGSWVQVLGSYLTKDSVTSAILHKLILECIVLLSNSGFHVDAVVTDGAQWNRGVWSIFGIRDGRFSCEHPCDPTKRLWMIGDFPLPHLLKC